MNDAERLSAVEAERDALAAELERVKSAKPLTNEQIAEAASHEPLMTMQPRPGRFSLFLAGARAIERAHGIAPAKREGGADQ